MRTPKTIHTQEEYKVALERIEVLISSNPVEGTPAYSELDAIATLVSAYEDIQFPIK